MSATQNSQPEERAALIEEASKEIQQGASTGSAVGP